MVEPRSDGVTLTVYGVPAPGGSKRHVGGGVIVDASTRSRPWKALVTDAAVETMNGGELLTGPLVLRVRFVLPRPRGHYGSGRNAAAVRPGAPAYPAGRPDV